jgi:hypothetical protein
MKKGTGIKPKTHLSGRVLNDKRIQIIDKIAHLKPSLNHELHDAVDYYIDDENRHNIKEHPRTIAMHHIQSQIDRLPVKLQPFVENKVQEIGLGLKAKNTKIIKGGNVKIVRKPKKLYNKDDFNNVSEQGTFSSYLPSSSPAMNPYVPEYNSFTHAIPLIKGNGLIRTNRFGKGLVGMGLVGPSNGG